MKKLNIFVLLTTLLCLSLTTIGCTKKSGGDITYSFFVSHENAVMEVGDTFKITATCGDREIVFESSDQTIVSVSEDGVVTANALGNALIEVRAGDQKRTCSIEVVSVDYDVTIDKTGVVYVYLGASINLCATPLKNNTTYDTSVEWSVNSNDAILISEGNFVTFFSSVKGEYAVTVVTEDGAQASVKVIVIDQAEDLQ